VCCVHPVCVLCTPCRPCRDGSSASGRGVLSMQGLSRVCCCTPCMCVVYTLYMCCVHPVGHVVTAAVHLVVVCYQCKVSVMCVMYTLYVCCVHPVCLCGVVYTLYVCCVHRVGHVVMAAVHLVMVCYQCKVSVMCVMYTLYVCCVHPVCWCCVHPVCVLCIPCRPCRDGSSASGHGVLSMQGLSHGVVRVNSGSNLTSLTLQDCGQVLPGGKCRVMSMLIYNGLKNCNCSM